MVASNIAVTHSDAGLALAEVTRAERISPHFMRLTLAGDDLNAWMNVGFDHWFRLAVPTSDSTRFDNLSDRFDLGGYLKYMTLPKGTRPVIRNYTVRNFRQGEIDVDFVVHGDNGVAAPWAQSAPIGQTVALIDQGAGFRDLATDCTLLVGDDSALPAVVGVLRDLDRAASGIAIIEIADSADAQDVDAPIGMDVRWIVREPGTKPGATALHATQSIDKFHGRANVFATGESKLATGARRHFVAAGVPKDRITFSGYWRDRSRA